jgi:electron transport complex protein RnfE
MAVMIRTRKHLGIEPFVIIALGLCPALAVVKSGSQALMLGSAIILVQLGTIAFIALLRRFIGPPFALFFTIAIAAGCTSIWAELCHGFAPAVFTSLSLYAYIIPALLPVVHLFKRIDPEPDNPPALWRTMMPGLLIVAALLFIAVLRELLGVGMLFGMTISAQPPFAWLATTPGGCALAAALPMTCATFCRLRLLGRSTGGQA